MFINITTCFFDKYAIIFGDLDISTIYAKPQGRKEIQTFLVKEGNEYKLFGEVEDYESDKLKEFAVNFTDVKVKTEIYGVGRQFFGGTPWQYIHQISCEILNKYLESSEYFNEQEKELLPLIIEISKISYVMDIYDEFKITSFTQLKAIASCDL